MSVTVTTLASVRDPREMVKAPAIGKISGLTVSMTDMVLWSPRHIRPGHKALCESALLHEGAFLSISLNNRTGIGKWVFALWNTP